MQIKIGASLICGAPFSPPRVTKGLNAIGYDCCQAATLRGWGNNFRERILEVNRLLPINSWEEPWREDCRLSQVLKGKIQRNPSAPTFVDCFLFPTPAIVAAQRKIFRSLPAQEVVHNLSQAGEGRILEVSHKMNCTVEQAINSWTGPFCIDLYHGRRGLWEEERMVRRQGGLSEDNLLGEWKEQFAQLFSTERVRIVHVSPSRTGKWQGSEGDRFCRGETNELTEMLKLALTLGYDQINYLIVELNIRSMQFSRIMEALEQMHDRLRKVTHS